MKTIVTAVFDIGKTNKKFFLLDENYNEVYREYTSFDEIQDEDGYPTENIEALQTWIKEVFYSVLENEDFNIKAVNFSTYGASFVHIDKNAQVLTPLYNYTKEIDEKLVMEFYEKYGPELELTRTSGSPKSGLLNSGMQLYWIKHTKPEIFQKIKYSLHLPQYLSYIFTGIPVSEYTSIGCHTALWNYETKDYQEWVYKEKFYKILPPIVFAATGFEINFNGKRIKVGVGIHDSSSALLPYVRSVKKPFVLVSTGTWSIALNPFSNVPLTAEETKNGCINYMQINSKLVKSSRLFLGMEYKLQVQELTKKFKVDENHHKNINFDVDTYFEIIKDFKYCFRWKFFSDENMPEKTHYLYHTFEQAYYQLMIELVKLQVKAIKKIVNIHQIDRIYVEGGFTDNNLFINLLSYYLSEMQLRTTQASLGSALGAAIAISDTKLNSKFLKKNYALKKHMPFVVN